MSQPFVTETGNIGSENGLYGQGDSARAREAMFGHIETDWPRLKDKLVASGELRGEESDAVADHPNKSSSSSDNSIASFHPTRTKASSKRRTAERQATS